MKNNEEDPQLRRILSTWQVSPPPAPDFKSSVWRRIATEEQRAAVGLWARMRESFFVKIPTPAYAAAMLTMAIALGTSFASLRVSQIRDELRLRHARQYLVAIDPLSMAVQMSRSQ